MTDAKAPRGTPPSGAASRGADRLALATILVACAYSCAMALREIRYLVAHVADDASYYLKIAENVALGHGYTFDRINPTNGFHPLWAWVLVAIRRVFPLEPEGMIRLVWVVQSLMLTAAAWVLWRMLRRAAGSWPAALGTVLFVGRLYYSGRAGMESALVLLLSIVLLDRLDRWTGPRGWSPGRAVTLGASMGAVMLARLDALFVCGALLAGAALARRVGPGGSGRGPGLLLAGGVAALLPLPYLGWNLVRFGHLVPISGLLKSSFPHPGWYAAPFDVRGGSGAVLVLAAALGAWLLVEPAIARRKPGPEFAVFPLAAFAAGALVHALYSVLFMTWGVFEWHFVHLRLLLAVGLPVFLARGLPPRGRTARAAWAVAVALAALASAGLVVKKDWRSDDSRSWTLQAFEAAKWADRHLPAQAVLAMRDAGDFGYFSRRRVVNLDGLVNGFEYQDSLRTGGFVGFLRRKGVEYYVQPAVEHRPDVTSGRYDTLRFEAWSPLYGRRGGAIHLARADEVYRSKPYPFRSDTSVFLIWRMTAY